MPDKQSTLATFMAAILLPMLAGQARGAAAVADPNPYLWLAQIHGKKALGWVEAQNGRSDLALEGDPTYARDRSQMMDVLNANTRIPQGELDRGWVLNFWQSGDHVRGIWRRTRIPDYARKAPHLQTLLDIDQLDRQMHQNWVWHGADCTAAFDRCLVRLSPGGGDAAEIRESDPRTHSFVAGGFEVPLAKGGAAYLNPDAVLVATDFGPGTMTPSSYPRIVKLWHRGEPLA